MNFNAYWISLLAANRDMKHGGKITMNVDSFKKQLQRAFDKGYEHRSSLGEDSRSPVDSIRDMLGMKS